MKTGKIPESILKRSVLKQIKPNRTEVIRGAAVGTDCAFLRLQSDVTGMAVASASAEGGKTAAHAICRAVNNLAAGKMEAVAVTLHLMLPSQYYESDVKEMMKQAGLMADTLHVQIAGGHTDVLSGLSEPVASVSVMGKFMENGVLCSNQNVLPGYHIVMTKWIGISGTAQLAHSREQELKEQYPEYFVKEAQELERYYSIVPEAEVAAKYGACMMHDVAGGGIFSALWELGETTGCGLNVGLKKIPVKQETIEVCEFFDINPYELRSDGALLMVAEDGYALCDALEQKGIPAAVIGEITDNNDKVIINEDEKRFLEPSKNDALYRIL